MTQALPPLPPLHQADTLPVGVAVDGVVHRDYVLRPATVQDNIDAINEVGSANGVELSAALYARQLVRLGTLEPKQITTALLRGMYIADFNALDRAAELLGKKLLLGSGISSGGPTAEPSSPATASAPSTPPS